MMSKGILCTTKKILTIDENNCLLWIWLSDHAFMLAQKITLVEALQHVEQGVSTLMLVRKSGNFKCILCLYNGS